MRINTIRTGFVTHPPQRRHRKYARKLSIAAVDKTRKVDLREKTDPAYRRASLHPSSVTRQDFSAQR